MYAGAVAYCTSLKSVAIPPSVTLIGDGSFLYCTSLTEISMVENNSKYYSIDGVLFDGEESRLHQYPVGSNATSYIIPEGITGITVRAFAGCASLTNLTMPSTIDDLGQRATYLGGLSTVSFVGSAGRDYFFQHVRWGVKFDLVDFNEEDIDLGIILIAFKGLGGNLTDGVEFDFLRNSTGNVSGMVVSFTEKSFAEIFAESLNNSVKDPDCDHEYIYFCWSANIHVVDRYNESSSQSDSSQSDSSQSSQSDSSQSDSSQSDSSESKSSQSISSQESSSVYSSPDKHSLLVYAMSMVIVFLSVLSLF